MKSTCGLGVGLGALLAACALPAAPNVAAQTEAIVGGSSDDGNDLEVVLVLIQLTGGTGTLCTGTLITPRIVLLAAHCLAEKPVASSEVVFADSWDSSTGTYTGALDPKIRHALVSWYDPLYASSASGTSHDVGLLYLDGPPPSQVEPAVIYRKRLNEQIIGKLDYFVGFGLRSASSSSTTFQRIYAVQAVNQLTPMQLGWVGNSAMTCFGDSGGPHFLKLDGTEEVAAVTAFGAEGCNTASFAQRIDGSIGDILQFIADNDPQPSANCGADGICGWGCATVDPDCPCVADGLCTDACADTDSDPDCPLGCGLDGVCQRTGCPLPDPDCGTRITGADCVDGDNCASALCVPNGSRMVCTESCGSGGTCPVSFACASPSNVCLPILADDEGSGCQVGGGDGGLWLLALLLAAGRRRRARPTAWPAPARCGRSAEAFAAPPASRACRHR